jgi:hypothetical protein
MSSGTHSFERCRAFIDSNFLERSAEGRRPLAVAISRQAYSLSHDTGNLLIERLGRDRILGRSSWALFDHDLVRKVLEDHDLPKSIARYMPEDRDRELKGLLNEILGVHPSLWNLFHYTCDTIHKLAKVGNVVLIGRGGHIITRHLSHVLYVRMIAPEAERAKRCSLKENISHQEALHRIHKIDAARAAYIHQHFNESIDDPFAYHLTLNTGLLTASGAASIIHNALRTL